MATIQVELVTPEKVVLQTSAESVVLPAFEGQMGVLPGHQPFLVELTPGEIRVTIEGEAICFAVAGGFAEVQRDRVSVFAETAEMADEIDTERALQALERGKSQMVQGRLEPMALAQAEAAIRRAQVRLRVAEMGRHRRAHKPQHG